MCWRIKIVFTIFFLNYKKINLNTNNFKNEGDRSISILVINIKIIENQFCLTIPIATIIILEMGV